MAGSSFPTNLTSQTRILYKVSSTSKPRWVNKLADENLVDVRFEDALPAREYPAWKGKRHFEGAWWTTTNRASVGFESFLERSWVVAADFDPAVTKVAAQPFALLWPHGTPGQRDHVPDYFARLSDGRGRVVDVRHAERVSDRSQAQFDLTRAACDEVGWQYEVWTGLPEPRSSNLRWLAGYRMDRFEPSPDVRAALETAFEHGLPLQVGVRRAFEATGASKEVVLAGVYHLLWHKVLSVDLDSPVSFDSKVVLSS